MMACGHLHPEIRVFRIERLDRAAVPHVVSFTERRFTESLRDILLFLDSDEAHGVHAQTMDRDERRAFVVHYHFSDAATADAVRLGFKADGPAPLDAGHPRAGYK